MKRPERSDEGPANDAREAWERVGYARRETEQAELQCQELRARREQLLLEIATVRSENATLEQELLAQLAAWRRLDEVQARAEAILPRLEQVTGSMSYRITSGLLGMINRVRAVLLPRRR